MYIQPYTDEIIFTNIDVGLKFYGYGNLFMIESASDVELLL